MASPEKAVLSGTHAAEASFAKICTCVNNPQTGRWRCVKAGFSAWSPMASPGKLRLPVLRPRTPEEGGRMKAF